MWVFKFLVKIICLILHKIEYELYNNREIMRIIAIIVGVILS
jgi:hypothetical protein